MRPCGLAGCTALVARGYCARHQHARERQRPTRTARGYSNRWARYSRARLLRFPWCVDCGRLADVTDHILAAKYRPDLFWDPGNHQSLCGDCNRRKGIREEGGLKP